MIDLTEKMVDQKRSQGVVLAQRKAGLPHHGAAGGAPSAVCADSEVTRIVVQTTLSPHCILDSIFGF